MRSKTIKQLISSSILTISFSSLVVPQISVLIPQVYLSLFCLIVWLFFATTDDKGLLKQKDCIILLFAFLFVVLYSYFFSKKTIAHRFLAMSLVFCGPIVFKYYYRNHKIYTLFHILIVVGILMLITLTRTLLALLINPYISRSIKSSGEYSADLARQGIGGYSFVYLVPPLSICILFCAFKVKRLFAKLLLVVLYLYFGFFVIKSSYLIALIALFVSSVLLLCFSLNKKGILILLLCILVFFFFADELLAFLARILPKRVTLVFGEIQNTSILKALFDEFIVDRWPTLEESILTFFKYPLFGQVAGVRNDDVVLFGIGQHSHILDAFAFFGLWGGLLNICVIITPFIERRNTRNRGFLFSILLCTLIVYVFDNATDSVSLIITIVFPVIDSLFNEGISGFSLRRGEMSV